MSRERGLALLLSALLSLCAGVLPACGQSGPLTLPQRPAADGAAAEAAANGDEDEADDDEER